MYLDFSKIQHGKKTYDEKCFAFRVLFKTIDSSLKVRQLHKGTILNHFQEQAQVRTGNAANKQRKNLVAAWNWGREYIEDFPSQNPFLVPRFPETRSPRYVPPEKDFYKVFDYVQDDIDKIMLLCFLHLAARRTEIFLLKFDDIDFPNKQVRLFTRKRQDGSLHFDWLPLTPQLDKLLFDLYQINQGDEYVFLNSVTGLPYVARQHWLGRLCDRAKIKRFGFHGIRHLSASILVKSGAPLIDIQTILRHKKITTTERYIHRLDSVRKSLDVFNDANQF